MEKESVEDLELMIDSIVGEWWVLDGRETFINWGKVLIDKGWSIMDIEIMFDSLYNAVAQQYGE